MYIVVGYVFLKTIRLVTLQENAEDIEHILTTSLIIGFIYYKIASLIPISFGEVIDCIGISLSSLVIAYLIGQFFNTRLYVKICDVLKIRESGKKYLWDEIMDNVLPMKAVVYYKDLKYAGYLFSYESYSNSPNIILAAYTLSSSKKNIEDNSHDKTKIIILNTEKADRVELIYDEHSKICNEIELFCNKENEQKGTH